MPGSADEFGATPARLFINDGSGAFTEQAALRGIDDTSEGRGLACFDIERDGDIDVVIQANQGTGRIYRNTAADAGTRSWLGVRLLGVSPNTEALGATIEVHGASMVQFHEMQIPVHYLSSSPAERVFGFTTKPDEVLIRIRWPDAGRRAYRLGSVNRWIVFAAPGADDVYVDQFEADATAP
ncbi:MAG: hypothetical protein Kow0020_11980 [Wenzhouxiangellaceae bacterium]